MKTLHPFFDEAEEAKGRFFWCGSTRFRLELPQTSVFCNGNTVWTYSQNNRQVTISDAGQSGHILSLLGKISSGRKEYEIAESRADTSEGEPVQVLHLRNPKNPELPKELRLELKPGSVIPQKIVVIDRTDTRTDYRISQCMKKDPFPEDYFVFSPPRDVQVFDDRTDK